MHGTALAWKGFPNTSLGFRLGWGRFRSWRSSRRCVRTGLRLTGLRLTGLASGRGLRLAGLASGRGLRLAGLASGRACVWTGLRLDRACVWTGLRLDGLASGRLDGGGRPAACRHRRPVVALPTLAHIPGVGIDRSLTSPRFGCVAPSHPLGLGASLLHIPRCWGASLFRIPLVWVRRSFTSPVLGCVALSHPLGWGASLFRIPLVGVRRSLRSPRWGSTGFDESKANYTISVDASLMRTSFHAARRPTPAARAIDDEKRIAPVDESPPKGTHMSKAPPKNTET